MPLINLSRIQHKILENVGKDGEGKFLRKELVGLGGRFILHYWLYRIQYSFTDDNGKEHTAISFPIYRKREAVALERIGTFPIKFIGGVSEIFASEQILESANIDIDDD